MDLSFAGPHNEPRERNPKKSGFTALHDEPKERRKKELQSNTIGDFFRGLVGKDKKDVNVSSQQANALVNAVQSGATEFTPSEVEIMYAKSGSKKSFKNWSSSPDTNTFFSNLGKIGAQLLIQKQQDESGKNWFDDTNDSVRNPKDDESFEFLGMGPLGLTLAIVGLTGAVIGTVYLVKHLKKGKVKLATT